MKPVKRGWVNDYGDIPWWYTVAFRRGLIPKRKRSGIGMRAMLAALTVGIGVR